MLNSTLLDDLASRLGEAVRTSPAADVEKNLRAMLASALARLDVVPRAEFDVQVEVLRKTRARQEALETRIAELEKVGPVPGRGA